MTYPAAYLLDESAQFGEQIGHFRRSWMPARNRKPSLSISFKAEASKEAAELALIAPSLIAEMTPLVLFWNDHLPVWEMSGIMAASFAFMWWMTWMLVVAIKGQVT